MRDRDEYDIFKIVITLWKFIGEHAHHHSKLLILYRIFNCVLFTILIIFVTAPFFQKESVTYIKIVESALLIIHTTFKYLVLVYKKSDMERLLNDRFNVFWKRGDFDEDFVSQADNAHKFIKLLQTSLIVGGSGCIILFTLKPTLYENKPFLLETWTFTDSVALNALVMVSQYYALCAAVPIAFGYDALYLAFCVHLVMQVRYLNYKLKRLAVNNSTRVEGDLIKCLNQHRFLMSMFHLMKRVYSITFLFHYFFTLTTCCIELYAFMGKSDQTYNLAQLLNMFVLFFEFAYYAFPAEQVAFEISEIPNSIYMSTWYNNDVKVQKLLLTMMIYTQRKEYFSGAGIIIVNVDTFGSLVRKTFSFYAVLRNILNK